MNSAIKQTVKGLFRKFGLDISVYDRATVPERTVAKRLGDVEIIGHYLNTDAPIIIDAGAHSGGSMLSYANAFPRAKIHSFEPNPVVFEELRHNITVWAQRFPEAGFYCYNKGLGNENGEFEFYQYRKRTMSSFNRVNFESEYLKLNINRMKEKDSSLSDEDFIVDTQKIDMITIDRFLEEENLDHVNLLKLDVEGHEIACLEGACRALSSGKLDIIFSELIFTEQYLGKSMSFTEFEKYLLPNGYRLAAVLNPMNVLHKKKTVMLDAVYVADKLFNAAT